MKPDDALIEYHPANAAEREALERELANGHLDPHRVRLEEFCDRLHGQIAERAGSSAGAPDLLRACQVLIVEFGGVHPPSELQDQLRAIHDEIWFRGERGEYDRERIVQDWICRHAANWRRWRLKQYFFTLARFGPALVERRWEGLRFDREPSYSGR